MSTTDPFAPRLRYVSGRQMTAKEGDIFRTACGGMYLLEKIEPLPMYQVTVREVYPFNRYGPPSDRHPHELGMFWR